MEQYLSIMRNSSFFQGMKDEEILSILHCLKATVIKRQKNAYVFHAGEQTEVIGMIVSGSVLIVQDDFWGRRNILSKCQEGDLFGEAFAAQQGAIMNISIVAEEDCEILLLNTGRIFNTCTVACEHHQKIIRNLARVLAEKVLTFNNKITHLSKRTTREKLLSYLSSESLRHQSRSFDIPFDRQQLADYLCVERSAMSVELSKLQKEGIIKTKKNHFTMM